MSDKIKSNIRKPDVKYCTNCVYPSSSAVSLEFDKDGKCSGCMVSIEKNEINWKKRKEQLKKIFKEYENKGNKHYDCIIPVSGGKDSYFQSHIIKELGYNALLVTYNANNYTSTGLKNVQRMREAFGFDHIFFTPSVETLKKLNRIGMLVMGDMNWHAHSGIFTYPIRVAVEKNIPLMIWGEHGRTDVGGMFSHNDFIEFTYRERLEHACRGFEWNDIIKLGKKHGENLTEKQMYAWIYPSDEEIERVGVRGIFLSNYIKWEANDHTKLVKEKYGFLESEEEFERTYRKMSNLDDMHENGIHDYLKFIKFGYGRTSDHGSKDIRAKLISRKNAVSEVLKRDCIKSKDLKRWLKYVGWDEKKFDVVCDQFRDPRVWWIKNGYWVKKDINGKQASYGKVLLSKNFWSKFFVEE
jgi:N-acetyl sugar amidotransferase